MILTQADIDRCKWVATRNDRVLQIIQEVAEHTGIPQDAIMGASRSYAVCLARDLACYIAKRDGHSYPEIGRVMNRDHSTIMDAAKREAARRGE